MIRKSVATGGVDVVAGLPLVGDVEGQRLAPGRLVELAVDLDAAQVARRMSNWRVTWTGACGAGTDWARAAAGSSRENRASERIMQILEILCLREPYCENRSPRGLYGAATPRFPLTEIKRCFKLRFMERTATPRGIQAETASEVGGPTRERLLDVAERLFAERGFGATSVRGITAEAGCNLAAVNYHFGGKDQLYEEVFRRRLGVMREHRLSSIRDTLAAAEGRISLEVPAAGFRHRFPGAVHGRTTGGSGAS